MALSLDDVRRIAHLARIAVEEAEVERTLTDLSDILNLIGEMEAVDVAGIEPMSHAQDMVLRLREDDVAERDQHAQLQSIAPHVEADLYLVPKVIE
jgi:aspartyl-tRNA(Asn)/glutamyl-tRNA(Gln) amidotransferase subunit C